MVKNVLLLPHTCYVKAHQAQVYMHASARSSTTSLAIGGALTFGDIQVEKDTIEQGLHTTNSSGKVVEAFGVVPPYPVDKIEGSVGTKGKDIVRSDGFCLACLVDHK